MHASGRLAVFLLLAPACGNGVWTGGPPIAAEDTDGDGDEVSNDYEPVIVNPCGNGVINSGEQCDDANELVGDGCTPTCWVEGVLLTGARIWEPDTGLMHTNWSLAVRGRRIWYMGPTPPSVEGLEEIALPGLTLMPGLIDAHVHLVISQGGDPRGALSAYLDAGVTMIKDVGSALDTIRTWRDTTRADPAAGPEIVCAGPLVTVAGGHPVSTLWGNDAGLTASTARLIASPSDAEPVMAELASKSVDFVKVVLTDCGTRGCVRMPLASFQAVVAAAHTHGMAVAVHTDAPADVDDALAAGADSIEHGFTLGSPQPSQLVALASVGVPVNPTLAVAAAQAPSYLPGLQATAALMLNAGVTVSAGSDAPAVGYGTGLLEELLLLVEAGATPRQAATAATANAAASLGRDDVGVLTVGALANIIAVEGQPEVDVSDLGRVVWVWREGVAVRGPN